MTDHTINPERGEVAIVLRGASYPMRPSYEAQIAIETRTGASIEELYVRARRLGAAMKDANVNPFGAGLKLSETAAIVTECVRAAGKQRNDRELKAYKFERVAELLAEDRLAAQTSVVELLTNMLFGGSDEKKGEGESDPAASAPVANTSET